MLIHLSVSPLGFMCSLIRFISIYFLLRRMSVNFSSRLSAVIQLHGSQMNYSKRQQITLLKCLTWLLQKKRKLYYLNSLQTLYWRYSLVTSFLSFVTKVKENLNFVYEEVDFSMLSFSVLKFTCIQAWKTGKKGRIRKKALPMLVLIYCAAKNKDVCS